MTTTRRADQLSERDYGRTITGTDALTGDTFTGTMVRGDYQHPYVFVIIKRFPHALHPEDMVTVTGAVVAPTPQIVGNMLMRPKTPE